MFFSVEWQKAQEKIDKFIFTKAIDKVEENWVYVNRTWLNKTFTDHGEEGLFAKKNIPKDEIISFYGGIILSKETWDYMRLVDPTYYRIFENPSSKICT